MKKLIIFNLKRRLFNKTTIIINILLFVGIYLLFHLDIKPTNNLVCLDESTNSLMDYYCYIDSEIIYSDFLIDDCAILSYDGQYKLINSNRLSKDKINIVNKDLNEVLLLKQLQQNETPISNVELITDNDDQKSISYVLVVLSISFTILISAISSIVSELIYEKNNHITDLILNNISPLRHFISKLITFYLTSLIQIGLIVLFIFINYQMVELPDLKEYIIEFIKTLGYKPFEYLSLIIVCFVSLLLLQVVSLLIASSFSNNQQATNGQILMYVLMFVFYVISYLLIDKGLFENQIVKLLSLCPGLSMLLMSCRIIIKNTSVIEIVLTIIFNLLVIVILLETMMHKYKHNMLNVT